MLQLHFAVVKQITETMKNYFTMEFTTIIKYQGILDMLGNTYSKPISYRAIETLSAFYYLSSL